MKRGKRRRREGGESGAEKKRETKRGKEGEREVFVYIKTKTDGDI